MYRPCGTTPDELTCPTAASKRALAIRAAYMLIVRVLTPFKALKRRDQMHPVHPRVGKEIEVAFYLHGFTQIIW
jgi:hypothetical protein